MSSLLCPKAVSNKATLDRLEVTVLPAVGGFVWDHEEGGDMEWWLEWWQEWWQDPCIKCIGPLAENLPSFSTLYEAYMQNTGLPSLCAVHTDAVHTVVLHITADLNPHTSEEALYNGANRLLNCKWNLLLSMSRDQTIWDLAHAFLLSFDTIFDVLDAYEMPHELSREAWDVETIVLAYIINEAYPVNAKLEVIFPFPYKHIPTKDVQYKKELLHLFEGCLFHLRRIDHTFTKNICEPMLQTLYHSLTNIAPGAEFV